MYGKNPKDARVASDLRALLHERNPLAAVGF